MFGLTVAGPLLGAPLAASAADLAQPSLLVSGVYRSGDAPQLEATQFIFGGQSYCWYGGGWRGPGYYYCGYAWRRGLGWGGGYGWHGWRGGYGYRGGYGGGHGGYYGGHRAYGGYRGGAGYGGSRGGGHDFAASHGAIGGHMGGGHAGAGHAGGGPHH